MVPESESRPYLRGVLVGHDPISARRYSLLAVVALGVFGVLFSLLSWNVFAGSSIFVVGVWLLLGGWTVLAPALNAYDNDGLLVSWFLASVGPFAVGTVLALSPALTGPQRAPIDVFWFALELTFEFGLPVGGVGFVIGSWTRIASELSKGQNGASRVPDRYAVLAGTAFLLVVPAVKLVSNTPKDILASPLDVVFLGTAAVGSVIGLFLFRLLDGET